MRHTADSARLVVRSLRVEAPGADGVIAARTRVVRCAVMGEQAKLANPDKAARQHVLDEAPQKLHRRERHRPTLPSRR